MWDKHKKNFCVLEESSVGMNYTCVSKREKEKQLDYGSINAIIALLFRFRRGFGDY